MSAARFWNFQIPAKSREFSRATHCVGAVTWRTVPILRISGILWIGWTLMDRQFLPLLLGEPGRTSQNIDGSGGCRAAVEGEWEKPDVRKT